MTRRTTSTNIAKRLIPFKVVASPFSHCLSFPCPLPCLEDSKCFTLLRKAPFFSAVSMFSDHSAHLSPRCSAEFTTTFRRICSNMSHLPIEILGSRLRFPLGILFSAPPPSGGVHQGEEGNLLGPNGYLAH